jgi:transposase
MYRNEKVKNVVGIDVGKRVLEVIRTRHSGRNERIKTGTDPEGISNLLQWLNPDDMVILEAGNQSFRIAKRIKGEKKCEVVVVNPGDVALIYKSLKKTDKEDSLKLARLGQRHPREELPEVAIPSDEEEEARRLVTEQSYWSKQLTMGKNRLHSVYTHAGVTHITRKHLSTHARRMELLELLPETYTQEALRILHVLKLGEDTLQEIDKEIQESLQKNIGYAHLAMSMPGIGPIATLVFLAYIGDCTRFSKGKQVSYYAGLVPRVDISGDTRRYGAIVKRGCTPIRRVMIQCAWALLRSHSGGELKAFYEKLAARVGKKKAVVALARKMIEAFYAMCKNGELYRGVSNESLSKKIRSYGLIMT